MNIIPLDDQPDVKQLRRISEGLGAACIFTHDPGEEGALA